MAANSGTQSRRQRFDELMQAGDQALAAGNRRAAHDRWREAATIDPYDEQVWLSLLRVLDDEEDRRVCLENIIAINPMNVQARRLLHRQSPDASSGSIPIPPKAAETATQPARPGAPARPRQNAPKTATQSRPAAGKKASGKAGAKKKAKAKRKRSVGSLLALVVGALVIAILVGVLVSVVIFGRH